MALKNVDVLHDLNDIPSNAQTAFKAYEAHSWKGVLPGATQGTGAGGKWNNINNQLPTADINGKPISYQEFDVNNKLPDSDRDWERFVKGSNGNVYYTDSHYGDHTSPLGLPAFIRVN